jgi:hypothetical protein
MERFLWEKIGPPLYYCSDCLRAVKVTPVADGEPIIERPCECNAQIIAPRKAIVAGEGGLNWKDRTKVKYWQVAASLTGRCV